MTDTSPNAASVIAAHTYWWYCTAGHGEREHSQPWELIAREFTTGVYA